MHAEWKYESEEIEVTFECRLERDDYGVPGSPTWLAPIDGSERVVALSILGVDVDFKALPAKLQNAIYELTENADWEHDG